MNKVVIMDYKKKYEEALERARIWREKSGMPNDRKGVLDDIFPELKESEDERIKGAIIDHLKDNNLTEWADWLEKHGEQKSEEEVDNLHNYLYGEQKPAWSEEDETTRNNISHIIRQYDKISKRENKPCWYIGNCPLWMQNIKDRVFPQSKQELSDWDKTIIESIEALCDEKIESVVYQDVKQHVNDIKEWLKDLKERYAWKPSDEQINALYDVLNPCDGFDKELLESLYKDLMKLRGDE